MGPPPYAARPMKPAPFQYHAPKTIAETLDLLAQYCPRRRPRAGRRAEPRADHGVPAGAAEASGRHQRRGRTRPARGRERPALHRRRRAPCRVRKAGRGRPARPPARHRSSATSRITRSAPAARSAAASRTPIRPPNGARSRRRSTPRWWPRARSAAAAPSRRSLSSKGIMTTALHEDELLREVRLPILPKGTYAGLCRIQPPRRRLRHRHGGRDLPVEERRHERHARRHRRRGSIAPPHCRGRARADRPRAEPRHVPGRGA